MNQLYMKQPPDQTQRIVAEEDKFDKQLLGEQFELMR